MPLNSLTNFEIQKHYQNELIFNGVYLRKSSSKIKDRAYVINLEKYKSIGINWIALYVESNNIKYFDSLGVERIPKVIKKFINSRNVITNIYRMQVYDWIRWGYFCTRFFDFTLKGKSLLDYTNLFSLNYYEKNDC